MQETRQVLENLVNALERSKFIPQDAATAQALEAARNECAYTNPEPVAEVAETFVFILRNQHNSERWPVGTKLYV